MKKQLERGSVVAFARLESLTVREGEVWITAEGAAEDIVLKAGQIWSGEGYCNLVIEALTESDILIQESRFRPEAA